MKYLITGLTGFAGPHLANLLIHNDHEVHGIIRGTNGRQTDILDVMPKDYFDQITWHYIDLLDKEALNDLFLNVMVSGNRLHGVFHLAAQSHPPTSIERPVDTFDTNIWGSLNLIEAIREYCPSTKLCFVSTSEVYGDTCDGVALTEESSVLPANPYGVSKATIDLYLQYLMRNKMINAFVTRAFSHTGPRRGKNFSISSDAYQVAGIQLNRSLPREIRVGNLETQRVVMDVRDCVRAYYLLMINPESSGHVFNICGDVNTLSKMETYTNKLIGLSGLDIKKVVDEKLWRPIDIQIQVANCEKLKGLTGWNQQYSIDDTLLDLLNYWVKKIGG